MQHLCSGTPDDFFLDELEVLAFLVEVGVAVTPFGAATAGSELHIFWPEELGPRVHCIGSRYEVDQCQHLSSRRLQYLIGMSSFSEVQVKVVIGSAVIAAIAKGAGWRCARANRGLRPLLSPLLFFSVLVSLFLSFLSDFCRACFASCEAQVTACRESGGLQPIRIVR